MIGHRANPNGDPALLEHIIIKQFTSGLRDEKSRVRVILKTPTTFTEAASYARFAEAEGRVAKNRSVTPAQVGAEASGSRSSGFSGNRSRFQSAFPDRGRSRSGQFGGGGSNFRKPSDGSNRTGNSNMQPQQRRSESHNQKDHPGRRIDYYNCHKLGHIARECRGPRRRAPPSAPGSWRRPSAQRVNAVGSQSANWRSREAVPKEEAEKTEASGYTANCINCVPKFNEIYYIGISLESSVAVGARQAQHCRV